MTNPQNLQLILICTSAFGLILLGFIFFIKALVLDNFDPIAYLTYSCCEDMMKERYIGFKKLVCAIRYEQARKCVDRLTKLTTLAFFVFVYLIVILILMQYGGLSTLKDLSVSLIPLMVSGVTAWVIWYLRALEKTIKS